MSRMSLVLAIGLLSCGVLRAADDQPAGERPFYFPTVERWETVTPQAAGWDAERTRAEMRAYAASVRRRYQIVAPAEKRSAA